MTSAPPPTPLPVRVRRWADASVVLVFAALLAVSLYGFLIRPQPPLDENRPPAPLPAPPVERYQFQDYPRLFDLYFADHVGYRDVLLDWHKAALHRGLDVPVNTAAWVGKDGWLYLNVADTHLGQANRPSVGDRLDIWADAFADRHAYLADRGIEYLMVVPPEKSAVYPEHLTGQPKRHPPPDAGGMLAPKMAARGVPYLDLLPPLLAAKDRGQSAYYPRDTHWTPAGARAGYEAVAERLSAKLPGFAPLPLDAYDEVERPNEDDLCRFAGAEQTFTPCRDHRRRGEPDPPPTAPPQFLSGLKGGENSPHLPPTVYVRPGATGPRCVLLRDSFGNAWTTYLRSDFERAAVVSSPNFPTAVVEVESPKVVIQEVVARLLYRSAPDDPPEVQGYRSRRAGK